MNTVTTHALSLSRGDKTLVNEFSLEFKSGECWAVLGANGCGKSTLLLALAGALNPTSGQININQKPLTTYSLRERARLLAFLPQDSGLHFPVSVGEAVMAGRHPHHSALWPIETDRGDGDIVDKCLSRMDLHQFTERMTDTLSGGERRRTDIATVLAQQTPICLLDEPSNHLDIRHQIRVMQFFAEECRHRQLLCVSVLHDVNLALRFCTHTILFRADGSLIAGLTSEVINSDNLEATYECSFDVITKEGSHFYFPRTTQ